MSNHTPGPWTWRNAAGAGLQISATLPTGFKFDGTAYGADGKTSFMIWTLRDAYTVQISDERWVQFSTGAWSEMQQANACLIAAAPDMLAALIGAVAAWDKWFQHLPHQAEDEEFREMQVARAVIGKATGKE